MRARAAAAALSALLLGGCGFLGGSAPPRSATSGSAGTTRAAAGESAAGPSSAAVARADRTHELPTPTPTRARASRVAGGWRTPVQAVTAFATAYVNWNATDVAARLRGLAAVSVDQARGAMLAEAAEVARDRELHAGGIGNQGVVEAVAPVHGSPDRYAVVTRERTTATHSTAYAGLRPAWHVALATVTRTGRGLWVVSGWQPES
jgi:hypothetical protein